MKSTKLIVASFVALAMFSCANEMIDVKNEIVLNPGDARIVFNVNKSTTTYATVDEENAIKSLAYALYDGENIVTITPNNLTDLTKVDFTVSGPTIATLTNKASLKLCILANGNITTVGGMPTTYTGLKNEVTTNKLDGIAIGTNGLVASIEQSVNLSTVTGQVNLGVSGAPTKLTRGVARFYVKADATAGYTRANIVGAKIDINNTNPGVYPFDRTNYYTGTGLLSSASYKIPSTVPSNQFNGQESAFYAYPTGPGVTISVDLGGETATHTTATPIEANKNYSITITPKKVDNKVVVDYITIKEWDASDDFTVDFNSKGVVESVINSFTDLTWVNASTINVKSSGAASETDFIDIANLFGAGVNVTGVEIISDSNVKTRSSISNSFDPIVSKDGRMKLDYSGTTLHLALMPNNTSAKLVYHVKLDYSHAVSGDGFSVVTFIQDPIAYAPNFSVNIGGREWMSINTQNTGNLEDDNKVINDVAKMPGATFYDKLVAYASVSINNLHKLAGTLSKTALPMVNNIPQPKCPIGYIIPTSDLLRHNFFGVSGSWANGTENLIPINPPAGPLLPINTDLVGYENGYTFNNKLRYTTIHSNISGYMTIESSGNKTLLSWRGSANTSGNIVYDHISGLMTSTPVTQGLLTGNTERFIFGVQGGTGDYADLTHTSFDPNNLENSCLVRCVKQTPAEYWK